MLEYRASGFIDGGVAQSVTQVTNNHGSLTKEFNSQDWASLLNAG